MISIVSQRLMKYTMRGVLRASDKLSSHELTEYYFGYGANLKIDRFENNHMKAELIGKASLKGHRLAFNLPCEFEGKGYAGLEKGSDEDEVWGALFKVSSLSMKLLDILEWVPFEFSERIRVTVVLDGSEYKNVWAYIPKYPKDDLFAPTGYLEFIVKEAKRLDFPASYIEYLEGHPHKSDFELDPGFRLSCPGKKRPMVKTLKNLYLAHDNLRQKVADLLP